MSSRNELKEIVDSLKKYMEFNKSLGVKSVYTGRAEAAPKEVANTPKQSAPPPKPMETKTMPKADSDIITVEDQLDILSNSKIMSFDEIREEIGDCTRCKLHEGRTNLVFGEGNPKAKLVFVGEGPGRDEDAQGRPFVGRSGKLLTKIIEAMGLKREEVYICNVVKCRPPNNRAPEPDEMSTCEQFLFRQLRFINPEVIVCLGATAAHSMLRAKGRLGDLRGKFHIYNNTKLMVTYHPAALLRNPGFKRPLWEDMQVVMKELGLPIAKGD